jgi:hypothetical protein
MKESFQIQIPTPCGENWERMDRGEQGRFCQHCQKTVVDFTGMTDAEVLGYFGAGSRGARSGVAGSGAMGSGAIGSGLGSRDDGSASSGPHICGRFLPEQLGRQLAPTPVQRNGWSGWRWVLASALMLLRPPEGSKPVKAVAVERKAKDNPGRGLGDAVVGMFFRVVKETKAPKKTARFVADSVRAWRPSIAKFDSVKGPEVAGTIPEVAGTIPVVKRAMPGAGGELLGFLGGVSVVVVRKIGLDSPILQKVVDTVSALNAFRKEDFVTLYPNPVERGGALNLAWLSGEGRYQLTLLSMRGQLVGERVVEVGGTGQVDQWVLPVGLAAGVYVLRLVKEGSSRVDVREVVVR